LLALGKIDAKGGAPAFLTGDGNGAVMIADHRLDDGQAKAGTLMFSSVVGSKESRRFFGSETFASIGDFDADGVIAIGSAQRKAAAGRHGIERVKNKVLKGAMKEIRVGIDFGKRFGQEIFCGDGGLADGSKLRLEQLHGIAQTFIDIDASKIRRGHFGEIAEAANDAVEIGKLGFKSGRTFGKNFLKLSGAELAGTLKIFECDLHWE